MIPAIPVGDPSPVRHPFDSPPILDTQIEEDPPLEGTTAAHPLQVIDASTGQNPRRIKVSPGLINSIVPQIGGTDIDSIPAPTLDLPSNTSRSLFAKLTVTTAGVLSSVELVLMMSDPTDSSAILGYQKIAVITTETAITNIVQYVTSSLGYRRCRASDHVFWAL